jgi:acyl-CoA reductase-like NAD-dependent aldehyde dehydrogenase
MAKDLRGHEMLDTHTKTGLVKGMFIGGEWRPAARTFEDINPSTGAVWAHVPDGGRSETRDAIDAAQTAFAAWASLHFQDRAKLLLDAATIWERRKMDYVAAAQAEGGGWFGKGMFEAGYVPEVFRAAAAMCYNAVGEMLNG